MEKKAVDWNEYARCYDALNHLVPYNQLQRQVVSAADMRPGHKTLDVGCGTGNTTLGLCKKCPEAEIYAIDNALEMLQVAKNKCPAASFVHGSIDARLPFDDGQFDSAVCVNVLYTLPNPEFTLGEINRVLKSKGKLVLTTPKLGCSEVAVFKEHALISGVEVPQGLDWSYLEKIEIVQKLFSDKKIGQQMVRVLEINRLISSSSVFNFYPPEELAALFSKVGFSIEGNYIAYAQQNHFVIATKE